MPRRAVTLPITPDVRSQKPIHPARYSAVADRPKRQVEVIGHEAIGQHAHGNTRAGTPQQAHEGGVVGLVVKDLGAGIATAENVVAVTA